MLNFGKGGQWIEVSITNGNSGIMLIITPNQYPNNTWIPV